MRDRALSPSPLAENSQNYQEWSQMDRLRTRSSDTHLYLIADIGRTKVKIGVSRNPAIRLKQLQTGSADRLILLATCHGDFKDEIKLHTYLVSSKLIGEWFSWSYKIDIIIEKWQSNAQRIAASIELIKSSIRVHDIDTHADQDIKIEDGLLKKLDKQRKSRKTINKVGTAIETSKISLVQQLSLFHY